MKPLTVCAALFFALPFQSSSPVTPAPAPQEAVKKAAVAQLAPPFALKDLRGKTARLAGYKGKIVLLNFWATWCAPCQAEMPELVKLQKKYAARGLQIVGVTYEPEKPVVVNRIARKFKINYPLLFGTEALSKEYGIEEVLPVTLILDREGKILNRINGIIHPEEVEEKIVPLLAVASSRWPVVSWDKE
jgi:cytochrome c biogenesis protein CcmG, thiol:disulfide interchange protein DsbE